MPSTPREYERLPGSGFLSIGRIPIGFMRSRLYLFGDHLLRVENARFQEKYRRFYLADIQSIVSVETKAWLGWIAFWIVMLLCASPGVYFPLRDPAPNYGLAAFLGLPALFLVVILIRSIARGRSCRTEIQTAGGCEIIPSLSRVRATRRALAKIIPAIAQAQATLPPALTEEWWAAYQRETTRNLALGSAAVAVAANTAPSPPPLRVPLPSRWVLWASPICALLAAATFIAYVFTHLGWFLVSGFMIALLAMVPAIIAVIRLPAHVSGGLRGINSAIAAISLLAGGVFYVEYTAASFQNMARRSRYGVSDSLGIIVSHPPFSADTQMILAAILAALTGIAGGATVLAALRFVQRNRAPATPAP